MPYSERKVGLRKWFFNKEKKQAAADPQAPKVTESTNTNSFPRAPLPDSTSGIAFKELYKLKNVLGQGAFSTVRIGTHKNDTTVFAVKCVEREKLSKADEIGILDEVSILKDLHHPYIVCLYDFFKDDKMYHIVQEQLHGGELFDRIVAKTYYNEKEARDVCKILLAGIEYCHQNNVAHRDLKPENLLLVSRTDDYSIKIIDFGFAKKVTKLFSLTTQCGTPGYVAPEVLEGKKYGMHVDMWSVGVILYILLGGYPPFSEPNQKMLFRKIRKGQFEFHEEFWGPVSEDAKALISSLLVVDPAKRLTATEALKNEWICIDAKKLEGKDLGANLQEFKKFNAKRKFKSAVKTVIAVNKLNSLGADFKSLLD